MFASFKASQGRWIQCETVFSKRPTGVIFHAFGLKEASSNPCIYRLFLNFHLLFYEHFRPASKRPRVGKYGLKRLFSITQKWCLGRFENEKTSVKCGLGRFRAKIPPLGLRGEEESSREVAAGRARHSVRAVRPPSDVPCLPVNTNSLLPLLPPVKIPVNKTLVPFAPFCG